MSVAGCLKHLVSLSSAGNIFGYEYGQSDLGSAPAALNVTCDLNRSTELLPDLASLWLLQYFEEDMLLQFKETRPIAVLSNASCITFELLSKQRLVEE